MDSKKSNKITEIVRLQQILKKWKKLAAKESSSSLNNGAVSGGSSDVVPKGYLAVCVGEELKRFVIPMEYLGHQAFGILLREAEEEFGFQQEGVLKIPCQVAVFEKILKMTDERRDTPDAFHLHDFGLTTTASGDQLDMDINSNVGYCYSPHHHQPPQMCR
ncbi:unnamed protein product [Coffea canephora]|uniref:Auxin-responsive protein SAUR72-like n=1 Tax=Coffea canephora TaxID=49390 RepID=A0A068TN34_COFCA|nr:unnamed protein product [Coffea canephora]